MGGWGWHSTARPVLASAPPASYPPDSWRRSPAPHPATCPTPAAFAGPSRQASFQAGRTGESGLDGSGASTPQRSPLRSSPGRQYQLHTFQRYLQQQLAAQQQGRYGPSVGEGSGGASHSGTVSGTASPHGSPNRVESPAGSPSPPGRRDRTPSPSSAALPPAHPTASPSRLSRVAAQQQQFAARLHSAGSGPVDAGQQQSQQAGGPGWCDAGGDGGSGPPSSCLPSLTGNSLSGWGQLAHAESCGFSSWGLPSPSPSTGEQLPALPCPALVAMHMASRREPCTWHMR